MKNKKIAICLNILKLNINSQEVTERKKLDLDYRLERISHSDLIEDDEIKESLPLIEHRFSNQEKHNVSNKNSTQVAEGLTILTEKINRIVTESVITWTFEIETPILESSDFENFLIKKHSDEFHYFLVSYIKDIENDENLYKKATLYPLSKESLNLDNLDLASKGEYLMDDDTQGGGSGGCEGVIYTEIEPCNQRGYHTAKYCCQHYGGIHGCSNSKPCDYTCTGTNIVTVIDFSHCRNGGSLGLDDIPDYNSSNNDNTQNSDGGMNDSGGSTSSNGGETITSPIQLEDERCPSGSGKVMVNDVCKCPPEFEEDENGVCFFDITKIAFQETLNQRDLDEEEHNPLFFVNCGSFEYYNPPSSPLTAAAVDNMSETFYTIDIRSDGSFRYAATDVEFNRVYFTMPSWRRNGEAANMTANVVTAANNLTEEWYLLNSNATKEAVSAKWREYMRVGMIGIGGQFSEVAPFSMRNAGEYQTSLLTSGNCD